MPEITRSAFEFWLPLGVFELRCPLAQTDSNNTTPPAPPASVGQPPDTPSASATWRRLAIPVVCVIVAAAFVALATLRWDEWVSSATRLADLPIQEMNALNQRVMTVIQPAKVLNQHLKVVIQLPSILNQLVKVLIQRAKTLNQEPKSSIQVRRLPLEIILINQRGYRII
jgi:hypothetical protein